MILKPYNENNQKKIVKVCPSENNLKDLQKTRQIILFEFISTHNLTKKQTSNAYKKINNKIRSKR